jgi:16S rRNA (adenine1518-N6/adenine1519-N6)-dimethyltransferase
LRLDAEAMPLSPTATRELLAQLGHLPKRFLGQNFLVDGNIVRKSLELAEVRPGDQVVEVGPGLGTLTTALLEAGAIVWAVEKDRVLHSHLEAHLAPRFPSRFHLLEGDAVEHPLAGLNELSVRSVAQTDTPSSTASSTMGDASAEVKPPVEYDFKIVANLPYAIATPWLDAVLSGPLPARMVLMLQQEAAQRYAARPGSKSFGAISVFLQAAYDIAPGHKVAAACFYPRPDVESHLLNLVRKPTPFVFTPSAKTLIRACFQQRRKQIGALLRARVPGGAGWRELLHAHDLSEQCRPEAIPVNVWRELCTVLPALA